MYCGRDFHVNVFENEMHEKEKNVKENNNYKNADHNMNRVCTNCEFFSRFLIRNVYWHCRIVHVTFLRQSVQ